MRKSITNQQAEALLNLFAKAVTVTAAEILDASGVDEEGAVAFLTEEENMENIESRARAMFVDACNILGITDVEEDQPSSNQTRR